MLRLPVLVGALLTFVLTLVFATGRDERGPTARLDSDAYYHYVALASFVVDGDLDYTNQYAAHGHWYGFGATPTGRPGNVFGVGPAVFTAPLFLAARIGAKATEGARDGFSRAEVWLTLYGSVVATLAAWVFAARLLLRRLGERSSPWVVAAITLAAGPFYYYAARQPGYAHPFATCATAWLVDAWDASYGEEEPAPRTTRTWGILGAALGAAVLARPQLATWAVLLVFAAVDERRRSGIRRAVGGVVIALAVATVAFLPQVLAWRAVYGSPLLVPQGAGFMRWDAPRVVEVFFSARNGLFSWSPLLAVGAVGVVFTARTRLGAAFALALVLQGLVNGAVWDWWGGGAFGGRRFDSLYVVFAYGLAVVWLRLRGQGPFRFLRISHQVAVLLAATITAGNVALAQSYSTLTVRIEGGEPPSRVIRAAVGPRLGAFAAFASDAVMLPVRVAFALRYHTGWLGFDEVVGVHALDELYPGLNRREIPSATQLSFDGRPVPANAVGFAASPLGLRLQKGTARWLVPLNERRPALRAAVDFVGGPAVGGVQLRWNGAPLAVERTATGVSAEARPLRRGVNVLEVSVESDVTVPRVVLTALDR